MTTPTWLPPTSDDIKAAVRAFRAAGGLIHALPAEASPHPPSVGSIETGYEAVSEAFAEIEE